MSGHSNPQIQQQVQSTQQLVTQMNELQNLLADTLKIEFKKTVGIEIPTVLQTKVFKTDVAMIYAKDAKVDEFVSGASQLAGAALIGSLSPLVAAATTVATVAARTVIGGGQVQVGFKGDSSIVTLDRDQWLIAAYSSVQICTTDKWLTKENFYVGKFVYLVLQLTNNPFWAPSFEPVRAKYIGECEDCDVNNL